MYPFQRREHARFSKKLRLNDAMELFQKWKMKI